MVTAAIMRRERDREREREREGVENGNRDEKRHIQIESSDLTLSCALETQLDTNQQLQFLQPFSSREKRKIPSEKWK
jgi:hypothetical protein